MHRTLPTPTRPDDRYARPHLDVDIDVRQDGHAWSGRVSERDVLQPDVAVPRAREGHAGRGGDGGLTVKEFENTGSGADAFHHCRRDAQKSRER
jgi:hypothetical protein